MSSRFVRRPNLGFIVHPVFSLFVNHSITQSDKFYIALLVDPYSGQAEKNSLQKLVKLRTKFARCHRSEGGLFQVVGPTTERNGSTLSQSGRIGPGQRTEVPIGLDKAKDGAKLMQV